MRLQDGQRRLQAKRTRGHKGPHSSLSLRSLCADGLAIIKLTDSPDYRVPVLPLQPNVYKAIFTEPCLQLPSIAISVAPRTPRECSSARNAVRRSGPLQ